MKDWPERFRLLTILATTKILLSRSQKEGWGLECPKETEKQIDQILDSVFFDSGVALPPAWKIMWAPTGPLQEIAMANGWSEAYIELSSEFDKLEPILRTHEANAGVEE